MSDAFKFFAEDGVTSTLFYGVLIAGFVVEILFNRRLRSDPHLRTEAASNFAVVMFHQLGKLVFQVPLFGVYIFLFKNFRLMTLDFSVTSLVFVVVISDFIYYWHHRAMHTWGILWSVHVVHHQPTVMNLSMATRLSFFNKLLTYWFYLPLALLGVPPALAIIGIGIGTFYQALTHVGWSVGFGRLNWILVSPRDHHAHHLRRVDFHRINYGGTFSVWDRLFGTWADERQTADLDFTKVEYGVPGALGQRSTLLNPLAANLMPFVALAKRTQAHGLRSWFSMNDVAPASSRETHHNETP